jgi:hypothetical protein
MRTRAGREIDASTLPMTTMLRVIAAWSRDGGRALAITRALSAR